MEIEEKLKDKGIEIPKPPEPVAEYVPAKKAGNLIFCSGQDPLKNGEFVYKGRLGESLEVNEGYEAARICAINCLAEVKTVVDSLDEIEEIVKVRGFVNSAPDFSKQPEVVDGASELLVEIFGEDGEHARSALGTSVLPRNIPIELEIIVKIKD